MRGKDVLPRIRKSGKRQEVEFAIRHNDQIMFLANFRNAAKQAIVEACCARGRSVFFCLISDRY